MKDINFVYDSIIIGGGVIGASVARYLSRYKGKFLVIEKHIGMDKEKFYWWEMIGRASEQAGHQASKWTIGSLSCICFSFYI